jgi:hypothetical protein
LPGIAVVTGDAALTSQYAGMAPADLGVNDVSADPRFPHRVGQHRLGGPPAPLDENAVMFTFIGHDVRTGPRRTT